jgi:mitochondrial fission protein ELM1
VTEPLPRIWILSRGRKGDLDQMLQLARAVGWPHEVKQLHFAGPEIPLLSRLLLKNGADVLSPPWPDLVLCAEASPSVIARQIRHLSGGRTRAVCIGRPAGAAAGFDLVITTAQYRIPPAPNVVELSMPLAAEAEASPASPPSDGPIAVIVGGPAFPDRLDAAAATALAADALAYAAGRGAVLAFHTSPRTPPQVTAALARAILPPHGLQVFGEGPNRYRSLLAEASEIVVTSDSVSMVSDALAACKPVSIYPLPRRDTIKLRVGEWLHRLAFGPPGTGLGAARWLFDSGLIEVAADRRRLFARLVHERRAVWFGDPPVPPQPQAADRDLALAVDSLRGLVARAAWVPGRNTNQV